MMVWPEFRAEAGKAHAIGGVAAKLEALRRCEELIRALELRIWPEYPFEKTHCPDQELLKQLAACQEEADQLFVDIAEMTGKPPLGAVNNQG